MSKLNHTKIQITKDIVKEVLNAMLEDADRYVDFIVEQTPEVFFNKPDDTPSSCVVPFPIITLLNKELELRYNTLKVSGMLEKDNDENTSKATDNVVSLSDAKKKPTNTQTH